MVVKRKLLLPLLLVFTLSLYGQETVRIASYNVKQYPNSNNVPNDLKIVLNQIKPAILLATELDGNTAVQQFLSNVLTPKYQASTEVIISWGNNNECAVFYLDSLFTYLGSKMITATTRPIAEFEFVHKFTNDTLIVFGVHLKANSSGDNSLNITKRASAVDSLRKRTAQLKETANYIVVGDFNILTSTELAMTKLTNNTSSGYFIDMLNVNGSWNKNIELSSVCTWSTRGGINTRFDMILISKAVNEHSGVDYVPGSFKIFGNDNKHFSLDVNSGQNDWFLTDPSIGTALKNASDHLPVYADFTFGVPTGVLPTDNIPTTFELKQNYPNPFNPSTSISYQIPIQSRVSLKIFDVLGNEIIELVNKDQSVGNYTVNFDASKISSGIYFYKLQAGNFTSTKKMVLMK